MPGDHRLRYGNNPHQGGASFTAPPGCLDVLNGDPSYINLLDILTGWQMTRDLSAVTDQVAAVSMKHCTPVGLAGPGTVDDFSKALLGLDHVEPVASAYLRARSSDWSAGYGDVAVIFGEVNEHLAAILARLVSAGIAATGYSDEALSILSRKRNGRYLVVKLDKDYVPPTQESREAFGVRLVQERNDYLPGGRDFEVVAGSRQIAAQSAGDLVLAAVAMKYSVSNNVVTASGGRTLSISAGQQSRILSTKLACHKLDRFMRLQQSEIVRSIGHDGGSLTDKIARATAQAAALRDIPFHHDKLIVLASDGFIPFSDNIEEAARHRIRVVLEPEGALRSDDVETAAAAHGITLVRTPYRYFYH